MTEVTFCDSWEEMMEAERKAREAADARITPAQLRYRAGDIVVSDSGYGFPIFHEILDIEQEVKKQLWKYGDDHESDGIYTLDLYREPHMRFYRFARNYSEACQEGELGDFHLSIGMARITREGFEELRERGFSLEPYQE